MKNNVLLFSGGMDSYIAWHYLNKPETLFVDLGQRYAQKEKIAVKELIPTTEIFMGRYGYYFEKSCAEIPGRNFLLAMYAAACGYDEIYLIAQKGEQNIADRSIEFFDKSDNMLSFLFGYDTGRNIKLKNPFSNMYKSEMVKWFLENIVPLNPIELEKILEKSISCYSHNGSIKHCGMCSSCFRKWLSFEINGIETSGIFENDVKQWGINHYIPKINEYDEFRKNEILEVLSEIV
jgi:7-cyano-7-deazaguanine synthase in queuosine biosynthesis